MENKLPKRFTNAVSRLYEAFHNKTLNAMDCKACACGNIVGNDSWSMDYSSNSGYLPHQLKTIESIFMNGEKNGRFLSAYYGYRSIDHEYGWSGWSANHVDSHVDNDLVFHALCAVVEYLCELDNIPNVMDYSKLFETENNAPKYECVLS